MKEPEDQVSRLEAEGYSVTILRPWPDDPCIYALDITGNGLSEPFRPLFREGGAQIPFARVVETANRRAGKEAIWQETIAQENTT